MLLQGLTAMALVHRCARIEPGETIVVEAAAGGTGTLAVQLAKRAGAQGDRPRLQRGEARAGRRASAPTPCVDSRAEDLGAAIREANDGKRVDAVLHMSGGDAFDAEMGVLAPLGRMVVFGIASREQREVSTAALLRGSKAVIGFWLAAPAGAPRPAGADDRRAARRRRRRRAARLRSATSTLCRKRRGPTKT